MKKAVVKEGPQRQAAFGLVTVLRPCLFRSEAPLLCSSWPFPLRQLKELILFAASLGPALGLLQEESQLLLLFGDHYTGRSVQNLEAWPNLVL